MRRAAQWIAAGLLVCCAACGRARVPAPQVRSAESAYSDAVEAQQSKDYASALEFFN
jgi:hypothetical protein